MQHGDGNAKAENEPHHEHPARRGEAFMSAAARFTHQKRGHDARPDSGDRTRVADGDEEAGGEKERKDERRDEGGEPGFCPPGSVILEFEKIGKEIENAETDANE